MKILLINPNLSECEKAEGDDLADALATFHSGVWEQGWDPNQKIIDQYGEWVVFQIQKDFRPEHKDFRLDYKGIFSDLLLRLCPERMPKSSSQKDLRPVETQKQIQRRKFDA